MFPTFATTTGGCDNIHPQSSVTYQANIRTPNTSLKGTLFNFTSYCIVVMNATPRTRKTTELALDLVKVWSKEKKRLTITKESYSTGPVFSILLDSFLLAIAAPAALAVPPPWKRFTLSELRVGCIWVLGQRQQRERRGGKHSCTQEDSKRRREQQTPWQEEKKRLWSQGL